MIGMKSQYKNKIVCPECGKKNCAVFDDGHHHCFTMDCGYTYYPNKKEKKVTTKIIPIYKQNPKLLKVTSIPLAKRGITKETAELLCPTNHPIGTKRLCLDSNYFETYNKENVSLIDVSKNPIERITNNGLITNNTE